MAIVDYTYCKPELTFGCSTCLGLTLLALHTCTDGFQARPFHVELANSGRAAFQLKSSQAVELTCCSIIITCTVTLHPAIFRH